MMSGQGRKQSGREIMETLKRLNGLCLAVKQNTTSPLDPMANFCAQTEGIAGCLQMLMQKHVRIHEKAGLQSLFSDVQVLDLYSEVLTGSTKLIFSLETPFFRLGKRPEFAVCLVKLYSNLLEYRRVLGESSARLSSMIQAFEDQFKQNLMEANSQVLRLDQVHDLLSHSFDLVSPPLINMNDVSKRNYFKLSMSNYNVDRQLVEVCQFSTGELAIFGVNSGEIPNMKVTPPRLLQMLAQGNYRLLNLGRSLLFPILRECDLVVVDNLSSGTKLMTTTGNGMCLKLQCIDPVQWESHWKACFKRLFDKSNIIPQSPRSYSSASLAKSSHVFQNFKLKHSKLEELRPPSSTGVPIKIPSPTSVASEDEAKLDSPPLAHSGLRRSKPLRRPLSILMGMSEEEEKRSSTQLHGPPLDDFTPPSYEDLELLNCEKLLEIDKSIEMEFSPESLSSPVMQHLKSASQHSSLDEFAPTLGENIEVSEAESFISMPDDEDDHSCESSTFNPSAEFYKPTLYRRKSTSLLSLFSSKNKKKLSVDTEAANKSALSIASSRSNTPSSAKSSLPTCVTAKDYQLLPQTIDLDNDLAIFESSGVKASLWDGRQWMRFGPERLNISIVKTEDEKTVMVVYERKDEQKCVFVAQITTIWKCSKAAAQDLQIVIPAENFIVSILPPGSNTLNIRSSAAEGLKNSLQHCIKGNLPGLLPSSQTAATLSSAPSTFSSHGVTRSSTAMSELADRNDDVDSLLLLPSVRVRVHKRIDKVGWKAQSMGFVDIYSEEYKGSVAAVKFDYLACSGNAGESVMFRSQIDNIHRIGRNGLLVASENEERLLEFTNKIVADQIYRLIKPARPL